MACPTCKSTTTQSGTPINVEVINNMCGCGCGGNSGNGSGGATGPGAKDPPTWFGGGGHGSGGNNGGPTGSGTGGTGTGTGDDSSGSGTGGAPVDGDLLHTPPTCLKVATVTHDFCSDGFEFSTANIRSYIVDACTAGGYNSAKQKLISVKLDIEGLCYLTAISLLGDPLVTSNGRKLTITDAEMEVHALDFKQDTMQAPLPLTPQFIMRKYDAYGVDIPMGDDDSPVYLDGQMAAPARFLWPCSDPIAPRDPAWLYMCVASFVTHPRTIVSGFDFHKFDGGNWPYDFNHKAIWHYEYPQENWVSPPGPTPSSAYPLSTKPVNDSSNYNHFWPIIIGEADNPAPAGANAMRIGGWYGTGYAGVTIQAQLWERSDPTDGGSAYVLKGTSAVFTTAVTSADGLALNLDILFDSPTVGAQWEIMLQVNDHQIGIWDLKGVFV